MAPSQPMPSRKVATPDLLDEQLLRALAKEESGELKAPDRLTQQDIAERVGSSRETVSRVFRPLTAGAGIDVRGGRIPVLKKLPVRG